MSISKAKREEAAYRCYLQGRESFENGDITAAIDLFLQSLALDVHFKTYACLYDCYLQLGKHEQAAELTKIMETQQ
ncbi:MAG: hypothetical protein LBV04_06840 [Deferribacteraceae bacterium]|jgi:tetratricopeptide (TPR) repeat protein|nr:hypothetical protein [Deferribacteraceae bacterium]